MSSDKRCDCLVVIGTGFMGASIAQAAKQRGIFKHVIGIDRQSAQQALSLGYIDVQAESIAQLSQLLLSRR